MTKPVKYLMTDETVKLANETAEHLFQSPYDDLPRARKISVADHIWNMGLIHHSRSVKDSLGVRHG